LRLLVLLSFLSFSLFALDISIESGKENFQKYSLLHLKDKNNFLCESEHNEFDVTTKIICAFSEEPLQKLSPLKTEFFSITHQVKNKTYFIIIKPMKKIKLYPILFDLKSESSVYSADTEITKHWMIVGYKEKVPYISNKVIQKGLNFPFVMTRNSYPYVGGLDMKGNPVHLKKVEDVTDYLKIKKNFQEKKYEQALEMIDSVLEEYPNSLFRAELLYYKIKVYDKLHDNDNLIEYSKEYLREHSGDENVPEVLSLTANAYSKIGLNIDADYFFDRLFDEHKKSVFTEWGYIYKGEMLEASGSSHKAIQFYKRALKQTQDLDVAVSAAYKLAVYYLDKAKYKEASEYITKVAKVKPSYFMKDFKKSLDMMYSFADAQKYYSATIIAGAIISQIDKNNDEYERLLKDKAIWLTQTQYKKEALKALNRYIKEFPYGDFEQIVKTAKDKLFFDLDDINTTQRLDKYNELIEKYNGDTIASKALYEKAKLLLKEKKYGDILGIKESILDLDEDIYKGCDEIVKDAAKGSMKRYLKLNQCQEVLDMSKEYNITLSYEWDDSIFECAMKGADYTMSKKIATRNLKTKDLEQRKKWLFRYIKIDFATGNYSDVIDASKDLISLIEDELDKNKEYKVIYRYLFDTYQRLEDKKAMLKAIVDIEKVYGVVFKDIERYVSLISIGEELKDNNIIIDYATKVMKLQKRSNSYTQSPYVEFTLYQAYKDIGKDKKALKVIKVLNDVKLTNEKRSRQKYLLGTGYSKLGESKKAKIAYKEAIKADKKTAWAKLAQSALELE
jgi:tetratricopeptide (TPR) repeat protein